jgi:hypothetical protein
MKANQKQEGMTSNKKVIKRDKKAIKQDGMEIKKS